MESIPVQWLSLAILIVNLGQLIAIIKYNRKKS